MSNYEEEKIAAFCMFCNKYDDDWKYGMCAECRQDAIVTEDYRVYNSEQKKTMIVPQEFDFSQPKGLFN